MYGFTDSPRKEASGSLVCLCQHVEYACTTVLVWERYASCIPFAFSVYFFSHFSFLLTSAFHALSSASPSTHLVKFSHSLCNLSIHLCKIWLANTSAGHRALMAGTWTLSLHVAKLFRLKWVVKSGSLHLSSTWLQNTVTSFNFCCIGVMSWERRTGIVSSANKHLSKAFFPLRK